MKRILFITTTPFYEEKGSSLRVYAVLNMLSLNYNIDLVAYSIGKNINIKNVKIFRTPNFFKPNIRVSKISFFRVILDFFVLSKSLLLLFKNRYDSIHCEDFEASFVGYILSFFVSKETRFVYDLHNRIMDNLIITGKKIFMKNIIYFLERKIIQRCNLVILNWGIYKKDKIFKDKRVMLLYDRLDMQIDTYEVNGLNTGKYIIYAGNFEPYQGIEEFLNLFSKINTQLKLVIVGTYNKNVSSLISDLGLDTRVVFLDKLPITKLNSLMTKSVAGVLCRVYGKQPSMKMVHYLLMDKPVIANDIECNHELLEDNINSFFYRGTLDLQNILIKLESNPTILLEGVAKTRQKIISNYDRNTFLNTYSNI